MLKCVRNSRSRKILLFVESAETSLKVAKGVSCMRRELCQIEEVEDGTKSPNDV